jgi:hypothetical protein
MQQTICAKVHPRLLTKANRLFTGSLEGRIIEILQNARRAGATEVRISNKDGTVTVQDNGSGITDFQILLDLGGSGWDEAMELGEDPAGVGLFSLALRQVTIISKFHQVVIEKDGWTGQPVDVSDSDEFISGTKLVFQDDKPWDFETVEKHAVFAGMRVIVDGKYCHSMPFCSHEAAEYPDIGCRVEVTFELSKYHREWVRYYYQSKVIVNFHGQVVEMDYWPGRVKRGVHITVDLIAQTQIRLMLPARTKLVENAALEQLKTAIEIEYFRYFQRQKEHTLRYDEYLRAKELGIVLPEATPTYRVGLIWDEYDQAAEVVEPKQFNLSQGYRCLEEDFDNEHALTNTHLLAATGDLTQTPFVPVCIDKAYQGYSWANLPKVTSVKVTAGKERLRQSILSGELVCVETLSIAVETSDGKHFASEVPMAMVSEKPTGKYKWQSDALYVTEKARQEMNDENLWFHLGGYNCEGDSYETQQYYVEQELAAFWAELIGPHENLRQELLSKINQHYPLYDKWQKILIEETGDMKIILKNGKTEMVKQPVNG